MPSDVSRTMLPKKEKVEKLPNFYIMKDKLFLFLFQFADAMWFIRISTSFEVRNYFDSKNSHFLAFWILQQRSNTAICMNLESKKSQIF